MTKVWEHAPCRENSLIVLLALADWANDDAVCWPSMQSLADKARVDRRSAQRIVRKLVNDGLIEIDEGGGRAHQHRYQIKRAALCRPPEINSDIANTETATLGTQRATLEAETATPVSPDPLVRTVSKPSEEEPLPFSSPEFLESWKDYEQARKEKRARVTPTIRKVLCKRMALWGEARAIAALVHSTGYTGLFEPSEKSNGGNGYQPSSKASRSQDAVARVIADGRSH